MLSRFALSEQASWGIARIQNESAVRRLLAVTITS